MVKASLRLLGIFAALLCGIMITLQVASIKKDLIVWLLDKALDDPAQKVVLNQVEGVFPFSITIPNLEIQDNQGTWLQLKNLYIKISYLPFKIDLIHLENLKVNHQPNFQSAPSCDLIQSIPLIIGQKYCCELRVEHFELSSDLLGQALQGSLQWTLGPLEGQRINLKTSLGSVSTTLVQKQADQIQFKNTEITYQDYTFQGNLEVDYADQNILKKNLDLTVTHPQLSSSLPIKCAVTSYSFRRFKIEGNIDLEKLSLAEELFGKILRFSIDIEVKSKGLTVKDIHIKDNKFHSLKGDVYGDLEGKELNGTFQYRFSGTPTIEKREVSATLSGSYQYPIIKLDLHNPQVSAEIEWDNVKQKLIFHFLANKIKNENWKVISFSGKGEIDSHLNGKVNIELGEAKIKGTKIGKSNFTVNLKQGHGPYQFTMLPHAKGLNFTLNSQGQLSLEKNNPSVKGQVSLKTLIARSKKKTGKLANKNIEVNSSFEWSLSHLEWQSSYQPTTDTPLKIKGSFELDHGKFSSLKPYKINAQGQFNLSTLMPWITNGDRLSGKLWLNLLLSGKGLTPLLEGSVKIQKGFYEIAEFGTCIGNINADFQAKGTRLIIQSLKATDGTKRSDNYGQLTGQGSIDLKDILNPLFDIILSLSDFQVASSDCFFARAEGNISLKGLREQAKVEGTVTLNPAGLLLEEVNPTPAIPILKLLNPSTGKEKKNLKKGELEIFPINLKLKVPKRFMIQGFGLESLWEGEMEVVNYLSDTQLMGSINLVKGKLDLLGKVMKISKGEIHYDKDVVNDPKLSMLAVREIDGVTINLVVEGRASNPKFTFMSVPALPEEEILSRLLFGKELSKISAAQSLQLASAAASMNGQKGLNILDKVRSSFGLDILEIKEGESDSDQKSSQAVSIGKEFGNVRVSLDQSVTGAGSKGAVSTALTPSLNLDIDIGGSQSSGVGLSWVRRY
jgi:autotransporter translocation and assembly factor TamB